MNEREMEEVEGETGWVRGENKRWRKARRKLKLKKEEVATEA